MKNKREENMYWQMNQKLATQVNLILLLIHVCFLIMFVVLNIGVMIGVNIGSILLYLINFRFAKNNQRRFICWAYLEIVVHMSLATMCVGWQCGFQLYFVVLASVIYYCDYLGKKGGSKVMNPCCVSVCMAVCFFFLRYLAFHYPAAYTINNISVKNTLYYINALILFGFVIIYAYQFEKIACTTEQRLAEMAGRDALTQVHNRRDMQQKLSGIFELESEQTEPISIAIIDVDDFKQVNDRYGHQAGDYVLCQIAEKICNLENEQISVCRWGGEEFLILYQAKDSYHGLNQMVEALIKEIAQTKYMYEGQCIPVTITAGVAKADKGGSMDRVISRADQYLYEGKSSGKNCCIARDDILGGITR